MNGIPAISQTTQTRLALGIDPYDAVLGGAPRLPLCIALERGLPHQQVPRPRGQPRGAQPHWLTGHATGRFVLSYFPGSGTHADLRIAEARTTRIYQPRRLRVPLLSETAAAVQDSAGGAILANRVRRVALMPGAAFPVTGATGLRVRILRGDAPLRWAHAELRERNPGTGATRTVAHGRSDDRGELVLLLPPEAVQAGELPATHPLEIALFAPAVAPVPATADLPSQDPLWDLPLESVSGPGPEDPVAAATQPPSGFVESAASVEVPFVPGRMLTGRDLGDLSFTPP